MRHSMLAVAVIVLLVGGCSAQVPEQTPEPEPSEAAPVDVGIGVVTSDQPAGASSHQRSENALLSFGETEGAALYTMDSASPIPLSLGGITSDETVENNYWVLEQDDDADVVAADLAVVSTANSGLNATPNELRIFAYDESGVPSPPVSVSADAWGAGWDLSVQPLSSLTMVDGTVVFVTEAEEGYAMVGVDVHTGAITWRNASTYPGHLSPCPMVVPNPSVAIACWGKAVTAVDPASGEVVWETSEIDNFDDVGSSDIVLGGSYPPGSGTRIDKLIDVRSGAVLASNFDSGAYDTVTGDYTLSNMSNGYIAEGIPALQVLDRAGNVVYELSAEEGKAVGGLVILAAYDGRTWLTTADGIDIVVSRTGDRDPGAPPVEQAGREFHWIPSYSVSNWMTFKRVWAAPLTGLQFDGFKLIRHPGSELPFSELPLLVPAP